MADFEIKITSNEAGDMFTATLVRDTDITETAATEALALAAMQTRLDALVAADYFDFPKYTSLSEEAKLISAGNLHTPFQTVPVPPHFCQGDPTYCKMPDGSDRILGKKYTFQGSGCAVTSVAMVGSWLRQRFTQGGLLDPAQMDDWLDNNNGYQGDGIIWGRAAELFSDFTGKQIKYDRVEGLSPAECIIRAKDLLIDHERPIIMAVQYVEQKKPRDIDHFVCVYATMNTNHGLQLRFLDPGRGIGGDEDHPDNTTLTTHKGGFIPKRLDYFHPA